MCPSWIMCTAFVQLNVIAVMVTWVSNHNFGVTLFDIYIIYIYSYKYVTYL